MNQKDHPIFNQYPPDRAVISVGEVPTPYQIYDGFGVFIGGFADLNAVQRLLKGEGVVPARTQDGKALMGFWVCEFTEASLGAHYEMQCSFFTGRGETRSLPSHPFGLLAAMLSQPEIEMLCHGLWNDTAKVVAYNRELLGLFSMSTVTWHYLLGWMSGQIVEMTAASMVIGAGLGAKKLKPIFLRVIVVFILLLILTIAIQTYYAQAHPLELADNSQAHALQSDNSGKIEQIVNEGYGNYLLVPAGQFSMGDNFDEGSIDNGIPREEPVHTVYLDAYYIGEFEITNAEYKKFIDDGGYQNRTYWESGGFRTSTEPMHWDNENYNGGGLPGNENFPVVGVSWYEAAAYCSWLSAKTGAVYRLPTEAEWEKAARGGDYLDGDDSRQIPNPIPGRRYPWGNDIDGSYANYLDSGDPYDNGLTPVGYYDGSLRGDFQTHNNASPYGAYDMAGNVYEWVSDLFQNYSEGTVANPQGPERGSGHVIRGSAFLYEIIKQRSAYRGAYYPSFRGVYIGIRCVREITEVAP